VKNKKHLKQKIYKNLSEKHLIRLKYQQKENSENSINKLINHFEILKYRMKNVLNKYIELIINKNNK
jgi:hypothetical protein